LKDEKKKSEVKSKEKKNNMAAADRGKLNCNKCCGNFFSYLLRLRVSPEEFEQRYKSREIDKFLSKDKDILRRQVNPNNQQQF
jgi:hypothetical protein